jgi:L-ascorbate metabolism protein UlaG (beta-lactamase superfamily)
MQLDLKGTRITWLGHATFRIDTAAGKTILIDPWVMGNPKTPERLKQFEKIDLMLCTHGHFDHIGDAVELAKKHNPTVVGIFELCAWLQKKGVQQTSAMNKGGTQQIGNIKITMVDAQHSCGIEDEGQIIYAGEACGYVVELENGLRLYHAGDTNVFGDMKIIQELYAPNLALIPIGDHFTMGPREAAYACTLLRPQAVIPMHFGTFPVLTGTIEQLRELTADMKVEIIGLKPGESVG